MLIVMIQIQDEMRAAIKKSKMSRYRISKVTGISQTHLSQFMDGSKGLSMKALEKVAECLSLEIVVQLKRRKKGK